MRKLVDKYTDGSTLRRARRAARQRAAAQPRAGRRVRPSPRDNGGVNMSRTTYRARRLQLRTHDLAVRGAARQELRRRRRSMRLGIALDEAAGVRHCRPAAHARRRSTARRTWSTFATLLSSLPADALPLPHAATCRRRAALARIVRAHGGAILSAGRRRRRRGRHADRHAGSNASDGRCTIDRAGRPDPEALLRGRRSARSGARSGRGTLRIYLGAFAGIGKTYAMLNEAQRRRKYGEDVVVGFVETHRRPQTEAMLEGLEVDPAQARRVSRRRRRGDGRRGDRAPSPGRLPGRRAGAHERPRLRAREALRGRRSAARRGHQRRLDAERPAPREPERHRRVDHGRPRARDDPRLASSTRRTR